MKRLRATITDHSGLRLEHIAVLGEDGAVVDVGTAPDADLPLPRAAFPAIARRHASILARANELVWIEGAGAREVRTPLVLGSNRVALGEHTFTLLLEDASADPLDAAGRRTFLTGR